MFIKAKMNLIRARLDKYVNH